MNTLFSIVLLVLVCIPNLSNAFGQSLAVKQPGVPPQTFEEYPVLMIMLPNGRQVYQLVDLGVQIEFPSAPKRMSVLSENDGMLSPLTYYSSESGGYSYKLSARNVGSDRSSVAINRIYDEILGGVSKQIEDGELVQTRYVYEGSVARDIQGKIGSLNHLIKLLVVNNRLFAIEVSGSRTALDQKFDFETDAKRFVESLAVSTPGRQLDTTLMSSDLNSEWHYGNYFFKFKLELPRQWTVWNDSFSLSALKHIAGTADRNSDASKSLELSKIVPLFVARPSPDIAGLYAKSRSVIAAMAIKDEYPAKTVLWYAEATENFQAQSVAGYSILIKPAVKVIGGTPFVYSRARLVRSGDKPILISRYLTRMHGRLLQFEVMAETDAELGNIEAYVASIQFYKR